MIFILLYLILSSRMDNLVFHPINENCVFSISATILYKARLQIYNNLVNAVLGPQTNLHMKNKMIEVM